MLRTQLGGGGSRLRRHVRDRLRAALTFSRHTWHCCGAVCCSVVDAMLLGVRTALGILLALEGCLVGGPDTKKGTSSEKQEAAATHNAEMGKLAALLGAERCTDHGGWLCKPRALEHHFTQTQSVPLKLEIRLEQAAMMRRIMASDMMRDL